jgi:glycine cleavage system aminomethyltransferase T
MGLKPEETLDVNGWQIPLTYMGETIFSSLAICDLSHVPKRALQSHKMDSLKVASISIPARPGNVTLERGLLVIRLTPIEARIMSLDNDATIFSHSHFVQVTDAYASFAVIGDKCFDVLSKLSPVDLFGPDTPVLFAAQAPVEDVTCLLVRIQPENRPPGLIVSCSRGYGAFLLKVFLDAGKYLGIAPAGWQRFMHWLTGV